MTTDSHPKKKNHNYLALVLVGVAISINYTIHMASIQPLYYALNGPKNLYGLVFASYELACMLSAPLITHLSDRFHSFKPYFQLCNALNFCGAIIYAFSFLSSRWYLMLIGRFTAGLSLANFALASGYIAKTTTLENRQLSLLVMRASQAASRAIGQFIGMAFIGMPLVSQQSSTVAKIFNFYTVPAWIAAVLMMASCGIINFMFFDPSTKQIDPTMQSPPSSIHDADTTTTTNDMNQYRSRRFILYASLWFSNAVFFFTVQSAFFSNLFGVLAGQYHAVSNQHQTWKVHIATISSLLVTIPVTRYGVGKAYTLFQEQILTLASSWIMMVIVLLVIPYQGATATPPVATYYVATALFGPMMMWSQSGIETVFNKRVTQYEDVVGEERVSQALGWYWFFACFGRFVGPMTAGAVTFIATPSGQINYTSPTSPSPSTTCAVNSDYYYTQGCVLYDMIPYYAALAGVQVVVIFSLHYMLLARQWGYSNEDVDAAYNKNKCLDDKR